MCGLFFPFLEGHLHWLLASKGADARAHPPVVCDSQEMAGHFTPRDPQSLSSLSGQLRQHLEAHTGHCWQQHLDRLAGCAPLPGTFVTNGILVTLFVILSSLDDEWKL